MQRLASFYESWLGERRSQYRYCVLESRYKHYYI